MGTSWDDTGIFWETQQRATRGSREDPIAALERRLAGMVFDDTYVVPELRDPPPGFLAYDLETKDPDIKKRGPSWAFPGVGEILGVAVAWSGYAGYFPLNHCSGNVDAQPVLAWLTRQLKRTDLQFICANSTYDMGWTRRELGLYPAGGVADAQHAGAILDEYRLSYSLDSLAKSYLGLGKVTGRLDELEKQLNCSHSDLMACLKLLPGPVLGTYAEGDARRTYDLHEVMMPLIRQQGLERVHQLESKLIPMSTEMRRVGMRVDVDKAQQTSDHIKNVRIPELQDEIRRQTGVLVEPWQADTVAAALEQIGVTCNKTRDGHPEVKAEFLDAVSKTHPVGGHILRLRKLSKAATTFLDGHILYHQNNGRLHAEFNQLRSEREEGGYGTVTGRFSSTAPNLQNIPVRDPEIGPLMRSMFLPDEGDELASLDYSSQEPRLAVHFAHKAELPGAAETVARYIENPRLDFHQMVAELCHIPRSTAKAIHLGLCLAEGQLVLTDKGLVPIENVTKEHLLWDGVEWVKHEGLVCRGYEEVVTYDGVTATPDHLVYCEDGYSIQIGELVRSQSSSLDPRRLAIGAIGSVPIRNKALDGSDRNASWQQSICRIGMQRLRQSCLDLYRQYQTRIEQGLHLQGTSSEVSRERSTSQRSRSALRRHKKSLHKSSRSWMAQLRRTWYRVPNVTRRIHSSLSQGVPVSFLQEIGIGSKRQQWALRNWQYSFCHQTRQFAKQKKQCDYRLQRGEDRCNRSLGKTEDGLSRFSANATNHIWTYISWNALAEDITAQSSRSLRKAWVYDLLNAGPRHRFTISNKIVSNSYGMGGAKLARSLGLPTQWMRIRRQGRRDIWEEIEPHEVAINRQNGYQIAEVAGREAKKIITEWEKGAPFVRGLFKKCTEVAAERGFIVTLLRRRCRFPADGSGGYEWTHKAMNRLCQSSAADQTKMGMLALWEAGIVPRLTVHDELIFSVNKRSDAEIYRHYMETAVQLAVPSIVDVKFGENWGAIPK